MTRHRRLILCVALLAVLPAGGSRLLAQGGGRQTLITEIGLLKLAAGQALLITALNAGANTHNDLRARVTVAFMDYTDDPCLAGTVCLHAPDSITQMPEQTLAPGAALSVSSDHIEGYVRARVRVTGLDPEGVIVSAAIVDQTTGVLLDWIQGVVRKKP